MDKTELHKQVDEYWMPLIDALDCVSGFYAKMELFNMWRDEKLYVDKFGTRMPQVVNITSA